MRKRVLLLALAASLSAALVGANVVGAHSFQQHDLPVSPKEMMHLVEEDSQASEDYGPISDRECDFGFAGPFPCENVDLESYLPLDDIGGEQAQANDVWGYSDPKTKRDYALVGLTNGTAFVDITKPKKPVHLGNLPTRTEDSTWRDIKVRGNHAYIVSEAEGHGMQVFDLTKLRGPKTEDRTFEADANYDGFSSSHNIAINKKSGFAYSVGTDTCDGGLHMVNIRDADSPQFAGCVAGDGYTHDTQVVNYQGPDEDYQGREIAFSSNEDSVTIVDVTNKANPEQLARIPYAGVAYTHQGWLTPDQRYFIFGDELDEVALQHNTRTRVLDFKDLDDPIKTPEVYDADTEAIDHNLYTKGDYTYQANYRAGLRVLDSTDAATADFEETGFFDVYPQDDEAEFNGAWSNYPYYDNGVVAVSGIEQGLFVVRPQLD